MRVRNKVDNTYRDKPICWGGGADLKAHNSDGGWSDRFPITERNSNVEFSNH